MDVGRRIREARAALGYTQSQLAEAIGLGRDAVIDLEGGRRSVKAEELWRMARELERPVAFFLQDASAVDLAVVARRGQTASVDARRAELWLSRHFDDYRQLLVALGMPGLPDFSLDWEEDPSVVEQAKQAADGQWERLQLTHESLHHLRECVEEHIRVPVFGKRLSDPEFCGMLMLDGAAPAAAILVNASLLASRRNFTIAHELGHLLWKVRRQDFSGDVFYRDPGRDLEEMFANAFAAHFLAPDHLVRSRAKELAVSADDPDSVMRLGREFGMSFQATTYRLQNLDLLTATGAEQLRESVSPARLPSFGWETEAFSEFSPLYWRLVVDAYTRDVLDAARCAEMLDVTAAEFEDLLDSFGRDLVPEDVLSEVS